MTLYYNIICLLRKSLTTLNYFVCFFAARKEHAETSCQLMTVEKRWENYINVILIKLNLTEIKSPVM